MSSFNESLKDHQNWLDDPKKGKRINIDRELLKNIDIRDVNITNSIFSETTKEDVNISDVTGIGSKFYSSKFINVNIDNCNFHKCEFNDTLFNNVIFKNCILSKTDFSRCNFENVHFLDCDISWSYINEVTYEKCILDQMNFEGAIITDSNFLDTKASEFNYGERYKLSVSNIRIDHKYLVKDNLEDFKQYL